jgi:hypothetical protein
MGGEKSETQERRVQCYLSLRDSWPSSPSAATTSAHSLHPLAPSTPCSRGYAQKDEASMTFWPTPLGEALIGGYRRMGLDGLWLPELRGTIERSIADVAAGRATKEQVGWGLGGGFPPEAWRTCLPLIASSPSLPDSSHPGACQRHPALQERLHGGSGQVRGERQGGGKKEGCRGEESRALLGLR